VSFIGSYIFWVAENRILKINFNHVSSAPPAVQVFFGPEKFKLVHPLS